MRDLRGRNPNGTALHLAGREADTMLVAADDTAKLRGGRSCCRPPGRHARRQRAAVHTHADRYLLGEAGRR